MPLRTFVWVNTCIWDSKEPLSHRYFFQLFNRGADYKSIRLYL